MIIALVMLVHILFANLHFGGAWIAVLTESIFLRTNRTRYKRLARSLTFFNVILFSTGATFAIAGIVFFVALYPELTKNLFHIYWWPLLLEALTFVLEIFFLYTYWYSWDRIRPFWHQVLGFGYAIDVFIQVLLINMVASGMMTPGGHEIIWSGSGMLTMDWTEALSWWFNPTIFHLHFHRLAAAISYFGFLLAMMAVFHYRNRKDPASRRYWDWAAFYGLAWGMLGLILMPILGYLYVMAIRSSQPEAYEMMMYGPRGWEMLLMVGLLSALFLTLLVRFIDRKEEFLAENRNLQRLFQAFLVVAAMSGLVLVQPSWLGGNVLYDPGAWINPLGLMEYKYAALTALVVIGIATLIADFTVLRRRLDQALGQLSRTSQIAAVMVGILGMWIVLVMGDLREASRAPWVVFKVIPTPGEGMYHTPISPSSIFVIWTVATIGVLIILWFAARVTAQHPESDDLDLQDSSRP